MTQYEQSRGSNETLENGNIPIWTLESEDEYEAGNVATQRLELHCSIRYTLATCD